MVGWLPPPAGTLKINFDASVTKDKAVVAYVMRNYKGVKAAILYLNASKIWLEGDSQIVVSWISSSNNEKYDTNPLMPDLKNWRRRCSSFNISHTHREANQLADYFAQQAMTMDFQTENVVHLDSYALQILNTDAHGITYQKGGITMFYLCTLLISSSTDDPVYNYCTELHC
ncbi:uncharacterized protein [Elaeis guineensis]|uniref:uncharacterized protein isoform X3 n=1 Tax=Elaeis guineensis var. tenera TaxID=51953 RepID=UPI003C6CDA5C